MFVLNQNRWYGFATEHGKLELSEKLPEYFVYHYEKKIQNTVNKEKMAVHLCLHTLVMLAVRLLRLQTLKENAQFNE